jgi:hypothetical protein
MTDISITDSSFDISVTSSYYLSIQAHLNGLSFCILDPVTNKYIVFEHKEFEKPDHHQAQLEEFLFIHDYFKHQYKKTQFLYHTSCYTLIPSPLYSESKASDIMKFNGCPIPDKSRLISNRINMCDSVNTFAIPDFLYHTLKNQFPDIRFFHQCTPIIESALIRKKNNAEHQFMVYIQNGRFDIIATEKHNLMLCNTFTFNNENDLIYMILFVFEQLALPAANTYVEIGGSISADDNNISIIKKYLKNAVLSTLPPHFSYSDEIKNIEGHRFSNLFNLTLCV